MSFDMSSLLFSLTIKSTFILVIVFGVTCFAKRLSSSERHLIWCLAFFSLILMPVLSFVIPKYQLAIPVMDIFGPPQIEITSIRLHESNAVLDTTQNNYTWLESLVHRIRNSDPYKSASIVYFFMLSAFLLNFGYIFIRINMSLATFNEVTDPVILENVTVVKQELGIKRNILVLRSEYDHTPWTWGIIHPKLILPVKFSDWTSREQWNALIHELSHIKRFDLISFLLARICCCLYWFHPLAWFGYLKVIIEAEKACDDRVLLSGSMASNYASQLMSVASSIYYGNKRQPLVAAMARCSSLTHRVRNILADGLRRGEINNHVLTLTILISFVLTVTLVACETISETTQLENIVTDNVNESDRVNDRLVIKENGKQEIPETYVMRELIYKDLKEVERESESGNVKESLSVLDKLESRTDLSSYERALVHNYYAYIYYKQNKYDDSIYHYEKVLEQQDIPKELIRKTSYTLSQLLFIRQQYEEVIERMKQWQDITDKPSVKGYLILGQAYYQLDKFHESIVPLEKAYNLLVDIGAEPAINHLLLMRTVYWKMGDNDNADKIYREIHKRYPNSLNDLEFENANNINALYKYLPIKKVQPEYPKRALARGLEGYVIVEFTVSKQGIPKDIHVVESSHTVIFDRAAMDAAAKFRYKPMVVNGITIEVPGVQNKITFVIEDKNGSG